MLLLIAGGLAVASIAFPYYSFRNSPTTATELVAQDWYFDQVCRDASEFGWYCWSYAHYETLFPAYEWSSLVPLVDTLELTGALGIAGGALVAVAGVAEAVGMRRSGPRTGGRKALPLLALAGTGLILVASVSAPVGVEYWVAQPGFGGAAGCTYGFFASCDGAVWFAGPGWFLLVGASALALVAGLLQRRARRAGLGPASEGGPGRPAELASARPEPPPATLW